MKFNLPEPVVDFLREGKQLDYDPSDCECGRVLLKRPEELVAAEVWIGTEHETDPHHDEDGYYSVPAVSISGECANYSPDFLLLWLPEERLFGAWDSDHWKLTVFLDATWEDIVSNPTLYLNAQWYPGGVGSEFHPWLQYEFREGRPF